MGNNFFSYNGSVFERIDGLFSGYVKPKLKEVNPYLKWNGGKIKYIDWCSIVDFFRWTYEDSKSESQVRLYYNEETTEWKPWAMPQKKGTGMTTHELDDCNKEDMLMFSDPGWICAGTMHHHCSSSAFQSGVDSNNEISQNGLHITIGHIDKESIDIDARVIYNKTKYDCNLSEWIAMPESITFTKDIKDFNEELYKLIVGWLLKNPLEKPGFPEKWKDNMIPEAKELALPRNKMTRSIQYKNRYTESPVYDDYFMEDYGYEHDGYEFNEKIMLVLNGICKKMNVSYQDILDAILECEDIDPGRVQTHDLEVKDFI